MTTGYFSFLAGGVMMIAGWVLLIPRQRAWRKVENMTGRQPDGLRLHEYPSTWHQFALWRKLSTLAREPEVAQEARTASRRAIQLELASYTLFLVGMILFACGARLMTD